MRLLRPIFGDTTEETDAVSDGRREFLTLSVATIGGISAGLLERHVFAETTELPVYQLDPGWGADLAHCPVDPFLGPRSCHGCSACHRHGASKLFASSTAADTHRAHPHCKCLIKPDVLPRETWIALFGSPDAPERVHVDRRWPWVAQILGGLPYRAVLPLVYKSAPVSQ